MGELVAYIRSGLFSVAGVIAPSVPRDQGLEVAGAALAGATYSLAGPWLHRAHEQDREGAAYLNVLM